MKQKLPSTHGRAHSRRVAEEVGRLTDALCREHLDDEYATLCRRVIARLARKRPSPQLRGEIRIWAGAIVYAIGSNNFLFDRSQKPHLSADDLSRLSGVPKSTLSVKGKVIRDLLRLSPIEAEYCRRELYESNPLVWMISVNGFIVGARTMPVDIQTEAKRRGLIPASPP